VSAPAASPDRLRRFAVSARRRRTDALMRSSLLLATLVALIPLGLIVYYLLHKGLGVWSGSFFSTDPTGNTFGSIFKHSTSGIGGIKSAILGTIEIVALASAIAIPVGIGVALWLVEYGKSSWLAQAVRFFIDVMTGVPAIVFGLFVYITLVLAHVGGNYTGWKGSVALALLMLPIVTRSAEVVLLLVPDSLREAALALGTPRWRVVTRVVLPTALPGLVTGMLLAIARGAGETAPLLFTIFGAEAATGNLSQPMNALPLQIFSDVQQAQQRLVDRAWGGALTLVAMILILTLIARVFQRRSRIA
jgi:phosphate transport system permease protein